jgi:phosphoglycolate phosphatase-like HAD superfamily hydrolase
LVFEGVIAAPWVAGALEAVEQCHRRGRHLFVVSGTPEPELRQIVERRGLSGYFDGVYGSPRLKDELLRTIVADNGLRPDQVLFVGDAVTDWEGARAAGVQFVARATSGGPDWPSLNVHAMADLTGLPDFVDQLAIRAS